MLVVRCRNPNSAERELIKALEGLDGVAVIGYTVSQGEQEREVDALIFTPVRAVALEVKAPMMATPREGELVPYANAPWTIGGAQAQFYGGPNPIGQAKTAAQLFANFLRERMDETPYVQVAATVSDAELVMSNGPQLVGQTAVSLTSQVQLGLNLMKKKAVPLSMVLEILEVMDLGVFTPSKEEVEAEWKNADSLQQEVDLVGPSRGKPVQRSEEKPPFFRWVEKFSEAFNTATVIFLFVWFLYSIGVLDATITLFDYLQTVVNNTLTGE